MSVRILVGDCRARLAELPGASVQTCVTSPPYFGLRDYGHAGQMGLESTPDEYVAGMVAVFREVRRVLKDDGTLWLNLGDSYVAPATGSLSSKESRMTGGRANQVAGSERPDKTGFGLAAKNLLGIPWRVAFALQADGWYLRSDIIWHKPNPMPESVTDRPTKSHEYLYLFAKGQWVTRVVQVADLTGDVVHFGKHVGAQEAPMREPVSKFCVRLASALFDGAQRQHDFSLPPFYAEEWKQLFDGGNGDFVGDHPCVGRIAAVAACLLNANLSTKGFLQEMDRLWLDLGARDALLVGRVQSLLSTPTVHVDADGAVTVHDSGEVCKFEFGHNRIVMRRPTTCNYYYDADAIAEPVTRGDAGSTFTNGKTAEHQLGRAQSDESRVKRSGNKARKAASARGVPVDDGGEPSGAVAGNVPWEGTTRNKRTVWTVPTSPFKGAHFATFPPALIEPCILAGSAKGDTVLDPFGGAGTTGLVADRLGRNAILCELNPDYAAMSERRIHDDSPLFSAIGGTP